MAKEVLGPNTTISVNSNDLSQWCHSIGVTDTANQVDVTGFGEDYSEFLQGLKTAEITASFWMDYAASGPDAILQPLYANNTSATVKITPDTTLTGSSAIVYTMVTKLQAWSPVNGAPGDAPSSDVTFTNFGTAGLTRGTV